MQHPRDRAVINGLVRAHRFGVVFFHRFINLCELLVAVPDVGIAAGRRCGIDPLRENDPQQAEQSEDKNYQEERATRTTGHVSKSLGREMWRDPAASDRSIARRNAYLIRYEIRPKVTSVAHLKGLILRPSGKTPSNLETPPCRDAACRVSFTVPATRRPEYVCGTVSSLYPRRVSRYTHETRHAASLPWFFVGSCRFLEEVGDALFQHDDPVLHSCRFGLLAEQL